MWRKDCRKRRVGSRLPSCSPHASSAGHWPLVLLLFLNGCMVWSDNQVRLECGFTARLSAAAAATRGRGCGAHADSSKVEWDTQGWSNWIQQYSAFHELVVDGQCPQRFLIYEVCRRPQLFEVHLRVLPVWVSATDVQFMHLQPIAQAGFWCQGTRQQYDRAEWSAPCGHVVRSSVSDSLAPSRAAD